MNRNIENFASKNAAIQLLFYTFAETFDSYQFLTKFNLPNFLNINFQIIFSKYVVLFKNLYSQILLFKFKKKKSFLFIMSIKV